MDAWRWTRSRLECSLLNWSRKTRGKSAIFAMFDKLNMGARKCKGPHVVHAVLPTRQS